MFQISNLASGYGQSQILHDLNLNVAKREIVAVMGRNGMGKTTLFKSLMGVLPQWGGQISVDGCDISKLETHQRVESGIAYVPQGRMIFPSMSVLENIQTGLPAAAKGKVPEDLYALFPVLFDMRARKGCREHYGAWMENRAVMNIILFNHMGCRRISQTCQERT